MPRTTTQVDQTALYEAALEGLELQKQRLEEQIRSVRSMLGGKTPRAATPAPQAEAVSAPATKTARKSRRRRNLSPEARKRIAEAQRKRWAAYRGESDKG
jgi:hypothetical protein